ncbi:hypothetical protein REPUB_Repub20aG0147900 [Reevesia pubescens]
MLRQRRNECVGRYVDAMRALEDRARNCYEEAVDDVSPETFVEMMILDGCFIVELIVKSMVEELREENDDLFKVTAITVKIMHDLLLLENQLPFFVLLKLYGMSYKNVMPNPEEGYFVNTALVFFTSIAPGSGIQNEQKQPRSIQDIRHLLGLLREAGIKFEKITVDKFKRVKVEGDSLFDIMFENGRMRIPTFSVYDDTERFFRNLMAYEQFMTAPTYVTDYVTFMDSLINSGKDVGILCHRGIINYWLGDDEVVATMFNRLRDFIFSSGDNFYYAETFKDVNKHCKRSCNIWKEKLRHNYCNTPWAMISFLAASALLLLALATQRLFFQFFLILNKIK